MASSEARLQWAPPPLPKSDFLRILVFQDGDHSGRTVLWDSALVIDATQHGPHAGPVKRLKDEQLLGELMFGSVPLAYQASSVKIHQLNDPIRIMVSSIFRPDEAEAEVETAAAAKPVPARPRRRTVHADATPGLQSLPATITLPKRSEMEPLRAADDDGPSLFAQDDLSRVPRTSAGTASAAGSVTSGNTNVSVGHMLRRSVRSAMLDMRHGLRSPPADGRRRGVLPRIGVAVLLLAEAAPGFETFLVTHFPLVRQRILLFQDVLDHVVADIVAAPFARSAAPSNPYSLGTFHVSRLASALPHSARMRDAYAQLRSAISHLYSAPRLVDPLWLSINTFAERRDQLRATFAEDLDYLIVTLGSLSDSFLSAALSSVLAHHPGWIASVTPAASDDGDHDFRSLRRTMSYDPLWAQLSDLFGAVTDPACTARTVLIGRPPHGSSEGNTNPNAQTAHRLVARLLSVISYFIRCNEIFELDEHPTALDQITTKMYADPAAEVSSLFREPTDDDPASIAAAAAAAPPAFPSTLANVSPDSSSATPTAIRFGSSAPVTVVRRASAMPFAITSIAEDDFGASVRSGSEALATPIAEAQSYSTALRSVPPPPSLRTLTDAEGTPSSDKTSSHGGLFDAVNGSGPVLGSLTATPSSASTTALTVSSAQSGPASSGVSSNGGSRHGTQGPSAEHAEGATPASDQSFTRSTMGSLDRSPKAAGARTVVRSARPLVFASQQPLASLSYYDHDDEGDLDGSFRSARMSEALIAESESVFGPGSVFHIGGSLSSTPQKMIGRVNSEDFSFSPPRSINAFVEQFANSVNTSLSFSRPASRAASPGWFSPNATLDSTAHAALNITHRSVLSASPTGSYHSNVHMLCHTSPCASPQPADPLRQFTHVEELPTDCRAVIPDVSYQASRSDVSVDFQHGFGRSLLAGQVEGYVAGLVLQAVPAPTFIEQLDRDLKADVKHSPFVPTAVQRASAVLLHLNAMRVEVRDVQQTDTGLSARTSFGLPTTPLSSMLSAFHCLFSLGTSPRLCVQLIEDRLQLILLQSRAVAQFVRERACDLPASLAARQLSMTKRDLLFYWHVAQMHCAPPQGRVVPD